MDWAWEGLGVRGEEMGWGYVLAVCLGRSCGEVVWWEWRDEPAWEVHVWANPWLVVSIIGRCYRGGTK